MLNLKMIFRRKGDSARPSTGIVGRGSPKYLAMWKRVNVILAAATLLAGAALAYAVASEPDESVAAPGIELPPPRDRTGPAAPVANFQSAMAAKKLFIMPMPPPPAVNVVDAIAKAKAKIKLVAITTVGDRMGAYFEVNENPTGAAPMPPVRRPGMPRTKINRPSMKLYYEGDKVGDFTVKKIEAQQVTVAIADREVVFTL